MEVDSARLERALKAAAQACTNESHGIHGPDSLAWKLGGEALNFLGGGRAALLQLAHPAVAYAIDQHSTTRSDPRGRFQRTFEMVYAMVFGDWPAAEKAARRVHRIHRQVVGSVGEDAGDFAAGDRYAANQVGYLRWVWATLVDTLLVVHDRFGGGLSLDDKRNYLRESTAFAGLFGLSLEDLPGSYEDFKYYFNKMLASGALQITKPAREIAEFL
ncbi:MAG: DUF2236 domain-containing protein, partial [Deltaproteobacteria bacterium]|nr:DUF2236 domain-containing protein [Deltaproteobacteria bacterium]